MIEAASADSAAERRLATAARSLVFATALVPIIVVPGIFFPFITTRNIFFRLCVEIAAGALLFSGVERLSAMVKRGDAVLKFFLAYVGAMVLSTIFGVAPWHSLFGDFERMGGLWAWLHLLIFYVLIRILFGPAHWRALLRGILVVADVLVLWGAGALLPSAIRNPQFVMGLSVGSTIGNSGLLAGYLLLVFAFAAYLILTEAAGGWRVFYWLSAILTAFGMVASLNRSAIIGLIAGVLAAFAIFAAFSNNLGRARKSVVIGVAVVAVLLVGERYLSRHRPANGGELVDRWSSTAQLAGNQSRLLEWGIALKGFAARPVFGYGPENHDAAASAHFDPALYGVTGGKGIFDRPHNAWIELLETDGLVGTALMLGLWAAFILTIRHGVRAGRLTAAEGALWGGASVAFAVYLSFWFFDLNSAMLWVVMMALVSTKSYGPLELQSGASTSQRKWLLVAAAEGIIVLAIVFHGIVPLGAARNLDAAIAGSGSLEDHLSSFYRVMDSSAPQTVHTFPLYRKFLSGVIPVVLRTGVDPMRYSEMDLALQRGFLEAKRSIGRDPTNDRVYVEQARLSFLASYFYGNRAYAGGAIKTLRYALRLSPLKAENRVLLSSIYLSVGDTARGSAQLDTAILSAPVFGGSYFFAGKLVAARGNVDSASRLLTRALELNYVGRGGLYQEVAIALEKAGRADAAARLEDAYLAQKFGSLASWVRREPAERPVLEGDDRLIASHLPIAYLRAGKTDLAFIAGRALGIGVPSARAVSNLFLKDLVSGRSNRWLAREFVADSVGTRLNSASPPGV